MSLTSTVHPEDRTAAIAGTCPDHLVRAIRAEVRRGLDWQQTADRVAGVLGAELPDPAVILPAPLRRGDPGGYQSHLLYAEPNGGFSVSAMVWLPGQQTPVHDHVAWCVTAVLQGREHEEIFALVNGQLADGELANGELANGELANGELANGELADGELADGGQALRLAARNVNPPGSVSAFAPPGDIHRVRNTGEVVAISMHVYGADISRLGNSIRREYSLPLLP
jgi:predicted metal-dependent enzyme (double-stranded beta helix superfamily)